MQIQKIFLNMTTYTGIFSVKNEIHLWELIKHARFQNSISN